MNNDAVQPMNVSDYVEEQVMSEPLPSTVEHAVEQKELNEQQVQVVKKQVSTEVEQEYEHEKREEEEDTTQIGDQREEETNNNNEQAEQEGLKLRKFSNQLISALKHQEASELQLVPKQKRRAYQEAQKFLEKHTGKSHKTQNNAVEASNHPEKPTGTATPSKKALLVTTTTIAKLHPKSTPSLLKTVLKKSHSLGPLLLQANHSATNVAPQQRRDSMSGGGSTPGPHVNATAISGLGINGVVNMSSGF